MSGFVRSSRTALTRLLDWASPRRRLIARVQAQKQSRAEAPYSYIERPRLSLIVLSFNHRDNVAPIVEGLRRTIAEEVIVCEDGSIDGSEREWQRLLARPNDFVIRSNDIHDSRAYNRAVAYARGEIIAILQDDDIPPVGGQWAEQALALFDRYPRLGVLGGHQGWTLDLSAPSDKVRAKTIHGYREGKWTHVAEIPFRDPDSGIPFMFTQGVSIGPIFYRRDLFLSLGGFNLAYSDPGEVGMLVDHELSLRAWLAGYQVAVHGPVAFTRHVGGQGTFMFDRETRERNLRRSFRMMQAQYCDRVAAIDAEVERLNHMLQATASAAVASA